MAVATGEGVLPVLAAVTGGAMGIPEALAATVVCTATPEAVLAMLAAATERGTTTHLGSQRDATAAPDAMRIEARVEGRFIVLIRGLQA
jgi:hypothetical protein